MTIPIGENIRDAIRSIRNKGDVMNICEGCIKQDVCKFKNEVEKYDMKLPEPLEPIIECKYKKLPYVYPYTVSIPSVWTGDVWPNIPNGTTTTWPSGVPWTYTSIDEYAATSN